MEQAERLYRQAYNTGDGKKMSMINGIRYRYQDSIFRNRSSFAIDTPLARGTYAGLRSAIGGGT